MRAYILRSGGTANDENLNVADVQPVHYVLVIKLPPAVKSVFLERANLSL